MFDLNQQAIIQRIGRRFRSNMYIPVYHTNGRSIKNMIGVVVNRLAGMGRVRPELRAKVSIFDLVSPNRRFTNVIYTDTSPVQVTSKLNIKQLTYFEKYFMARNTVPPVKIGTAPNFWWI